jgi:glutathione peroxidase
MMRRNLTKRAAQLSIAALLASLNAAAIADEPGAKPSVLNHVVEDIDGNKVDLNQYRGKVVVIVNVASKCGQTKQYKPLEALYKLHEKDGLVVIGFPANDFKGQEPGSAEEIKAFCTEKYDVTFPLMSKISVKSPNKSPVYQFLTEKQTAGEFAGEIPWNFTKFVIGRDGQIAGRFDTKIQPTDPAFVSAVETALAMK